jgi:hypothetical protein
MAKLIFISHGGGDSSKAAVVAGMLTQARIGVCFDRQELRLGDSFLDFMERGLSAADYCLLLWSRNAAGTPWVRLEWEAALYRSIQQQRSFLVVARLEEIPPPALLGPRLRVDLFPDLQPGLGQVIASWQGDREAESETKRPVAGFPIAESGSRGPQTIYITSEQFGVTVPMDADLKEPAGVYLDRLIVDFNLPRVLDYENRIGVRFSYRLMNGTRPLDRGIPLAAQRVKDKRVLWLETTMTPYSQSAPAQGTLGSAVFRGASQTAEMERVESLARRDYLNMIARSGLGA